MSNVNEILAERGSRYGKFEEHARISQALKTAMQWPGLHRMEDDQCEALEMIAHKIARILNGDPDYVDSWADIAGYATLIVRRLEDEASLETKRGALEMRLAEAMLADAARHA